MTAFARVPIARDWETDDDFRYFREQYRESIETMFAAVTDLYARHWSDFFHFAIFETDEESWEEAFDRTHVKYMNALGIGRARKILEIGCGRGGFAELLAAKTSGEVLGIDLSRAQLAHARRRRRQNLRFARYDVMQLDELGERFNAVACIDAACYFPDKRLAVEKIAKVIAPGGRLLLVEWCKREGLNALQEELVLRPFMRHWAVPSLETPSNYATYLERSGFDVVEITDLNDQVRRNWDVAYERAIEAVRDLSYGEATRMAWKLKRLGSDGVRIAKEQFPAALYIKAAYDAGFLRYTYVVAERKAEA
jgi:cyclopropane-fatty-acyl-phospholipid synthase